MNIDQEILAFEQQLLSPQVRQDRARLRALLAEQFIEFGAAGLAWTRDQVITGLMTEPPVERVISGFNARPLAEGVVLATYVCEHRYAGGRVSSSLRSSIWQRRGTGWEMVFHQGTPIAVLQSVSVSCKE